MKSHKQLGIVIVALIVSLGTAHLAYAENGVSDNEIVLGSSLALEGHSSYLGTQCHHGAMAYLNFINEKGGASNRKIKLITYDDSYDPAKCEQNTNKLIEQDKVFALFNYVGTPTAAQVLPIVQKAKIPMFSPYTGAEVFRNPVIKEVFNIRSSYYQETQGIVNHFWNTLGVRKIAVFYQNDAYGEAGLKGVELALQKLGSKPVASASYERGTNTIAPALKTLQDASPEAIVMVGTYAPSAYLVQSSKWSNFNPFFHSVSFVGADEFARLIGVGRDSDGVIVTQVVPPQSSALPVVKEYQDLLKKYYPSDKPNFVSFEGFINAKALVAVLQRMGQDATREGFIKAAESIRYLDIGLDTKINFAPNNHQGSDMVYFTIIKNGQYHLITDEDWKAMKKKMLPH